MSKKEKTLNQKIAEINSLWDNEELYVQLSPEREKFCFVDFESEDEDCVVHYDTSNCLMPDISILNSVNLDFNTDWIAWELELME